MKLRDEILQLRQAGIEKAAAIWETLENLPTPLTPADIYKASTAAKCSEFVNRIRENKLALDLTKIILQFLEDTLAIVGVDAGTVSEGARAHVVIAGEMPLTDEVYNDPIAYAVRQHVYDGLLLLAAAKLGKEVETKKCIDDMQYGIKNTLILSYYKSTEDPNKVQA